MNGPLLISLLPPEQTWDSPVAISGHTSFVAILLLIGFLLSLLLRHPGHWPVHRSPRRNGCRGSGSRRRSGEETQVARTARAVHLRTSGIGGTYGARTSVARSRSRRRGDGLLCYCCRPQWFQVNPLPDMQTDRLSGISWSNRDSSVQGSSMELPVRKYTGSLDKPLHSTGAYREGVSPRCSIGPTVNPAGRRRCERRSWTPRTYPARERGWRRNGSRWRRSEQPEVARPARAVHLWVEWSRITFSHK